MRAKWGRTLLIGAVLAVGWRVLKALAQSRRSGAEMSENLSRWEGEGGHVPDVEPPRVNTRQRPSSEF